MGLFSHAFSPDAIANASSIINGNGPAMTDADRLRKLLEQIRGGLRGGSDPYNVGPINVTPQNRGGGLMNYFGGQ